MNGGEKKRRRKNKRIFKENFVGRLGKILKKLVLSFLLIYTSYSNFDWRLPNIIAIALFN